MTDPGNYCLDCLLVKNYPAGSARFTNGQQDDTQYHSQLLIKRTLTYVDRICSFSDYLNPKLHMKLVSAFYVQSVRVSEM